MKRYHVSQLDEVPTVPCPCGQASRSFSEVENGPATVHIVEVSETARKHFHKKTTEIYVVLEGEGELEVDGERVPLAPLTSVMIQPGCIHRAIRRGGTLKIL
ncbi:MAG: cupin domain-containing protein, partial [Verrucomicrobiota bacterium]